MQIEIKKVVYPGKSMAINNGKVVFTDEGLAQESVDVRIVKEKSNLTEAETVKIIKPSKERTTPRCEHYKACSLYQYINYDYQLIIKEEQIKEIFERSLSIKLDDFKIIPSPEIWGYRNKMRLHILWDKTAYLAYHYPETHNKFIEIQECHLASKQTNKLFKSLLNLINKNALTIIQEAEVKENSCSEMLLTLFGKKPDDYDALSKHLAALKEDLSLKGIVYVNKENSIETILYGENHLNEKLDSKNLRIGAQSFFQINIAALKLLLKDIDTALKSFKYETIADLYCGIGTFGIFFSSNAKRIIFVESASENTGFLKENLKVNKINNATVLEGYSEELIPEVLKEKIDVLIVDPPRKGIGKVMCENILKNPVKYILYVSCDPATLTRDLKMLLEKYELKNAIGYDFFPNTPHIEMLTVLVKK